MGMLKNKIIVVTGGAGLLGRDFVRGIAEQGGVAVAADINFNPAEHFVVEEVVQNSSGCIKSAYLDITSINSIQALIGDIDARYGRIDAVVNSAYPRNASYGRKLEDVSYVDFCENVNMHLGGYFLVTQQFCKYFKEHQQGNVVNISSIYGVMPPRFGIYEGTSMTMPVEYAAIKSAVIQLTQYFAEYYKGTGIRVNCLSLGGILAGQPPEFLRAYNKFCASKGMLDPSDVSGALQLLLSDASRYITGQNLIVDDGFSL